MAIRPYQGPCGINIEQSTNDNEPTNIEARTNRLRLNLRPNNIATNEAMGGKNSNKSLIIPLFSVNQPNVRAKYVTTVNIIDTKINEKFSDIKKPSSELKTINLTIPEQKSESFICIDKEITCPEIHIFEKLDDKNFNTEFLR